MRAHEQDTTQDPARQRASVERVAPPAAGTAVVAGVGSGQLADLQRAVGNAAVARILGERGQGRHSAVHDVLRSPGRPLDAPLRAEMETRLGADFSDVRVHTGATAQASARDLGARAYTSGHHVVIGEGGADRHTLAHELTHVVQQRRGPVAGTDHGDGLRVSDPSDRFEREAEAAAVSAMSRPLQRAAVAPEPPAHAGGAPVVQRKGQAALAGQLTPPPAPGKKGFGAFLKKASPSRVTGIQQQLAQYDASDIRDPEQCMITLAAVQVDIAMFEDATKDLSEDEKLYLKTARRLVSEELVTVSGQAQRDAALPADAAAAYDAMTGGGVLWNQAGLPDNAARYDMTGYAYFRELSDLNRGDMAREIRPKADDAWVARVTGDLERELRSGILTHYTEAKSHAAMVKGGNMMKSKTELDKDSPGQRNNTSDYDSVALANEGFTFFFLEPEGSPVRDTRFARPEDPADDSARITLRVSDTDMETKGWAMLSDFAQREYPVLKADPGQPADTESFLPGREQKDPAKSLDVRRFARAQVDPDRLVEIITEGQDISDPGRRQATSRSRQDAETDTRHRMVYGPDENDPENTYPELIHHNVLVGPDIIEGLAQRAVVEIMRIEKVNRPLADRMKAMSPKELARFLLKDLVRAQIMLPNRTLLDNAHVDIYNAQERFGAPGR